jgi:protein translocase SecG subunit
MILNFYPALTAFSWSGIFWTLGGCLIAFLALLMIISIVFLQDSKDGGLGGAFGSAGGGDALLGAGGQKGIVKITALISLIFTALVIGWGMIDMSGTGIGEPANPEESSKEHEILNPPPPATGAGVVPGLSPGGGSLLPAPGGAGGAGGSSDGGDK